MRIGILVLLVLFCTGLLLIWYETAEQPALAGPLSARVGPYTAENEAEFSSLPAYPEGFPSHLRSADLSRDLLLGGQVIQDTAPPDPEHLEHYELTFISARDPVRIVLSFERAVARAGFEIELKPHSAGDVRRALDERALDFYAWQDDSVVSLQAIKLDPQRFPQFDLTSVPADCYLYQIRQVRLAHPPMRS